MKWILPFSIIAFLTANINAQSSDYVVKRYAKIHEGHKYSIMENVFENGYKENFVTNIPLEELKRRSDFSTKLAALNIYWDEDLDREGLQKTVMDHLAVQNAFNNAFSVYEKQKGLKQGSIERIFLSTNFNNLTNDNQSKLILEKLRLSFLPLYDIEIENSSELIKSGAQIASFLNNQAEIQKYVNVQTLYNWFFVDQHARWKNKAFVLGIEGNGTERLCDKAGNNFLVKEEVEAILLKIISNPEMNTRQHFCLGRNFTFEIANNDDYDQNSLKNGIGN